MHQMVRFRKTNYLMKYKNIVEIFDNIIQQGIGKKAFLEDQGKKHSYNDLDREVRKLGHLYQLARLKEGDRVVVSVNSCYDLSVLFMSLLRYGLTTVILDPTVNPDRARAIISTSEVSGYIMEENLFERWKVETTGAFFLKVKRAPRKKGLIFRKLLKNKEQSSQADSNSYPAIMETIEPVHNLPPQVNENTLAYILFTSGTTSYPKGVMITHRNLLVHMESLSRIYQLDSGFRMLNNLNLYHTDGITQGITLTIYTGGTLVRPLEKFEIPTIADLFHHIYKSRITHFIVSPTILSLMLKLSDGYEDSFDTPDFEFIISSSATLEINLWKRFEQTFKTRIVNVFGLTETVSGSLYCGPDENTTKIGTVGKPIDCEAKLIREDGSLAGDHEEGELVLKGEHITSGYFNNAEATSEALKDGWFYTGDIAVRDADGFYRIIGRKKNMLNVGGVSIHPEEIAEIVNTHPAVQENVCLGLEEEVFGEKLVCCAVKKKGFDLDKFELTEFLRQRLERNKVPADIFFMDALPKTPSMKVKVGELKKQISNRSSVTTNGKNFENTVLTAASEAFRIPPEKLSINDSVQSLESWDSMGHLLFVTNLEQKTGVRFTTAEILVMTNLKTADEMLKKKMVS